MTAEKNGDRRPGAFIRNVRDPDAGHRGEQLAGEVVGGADAGRAVLDLPRLRLGDPDQVGDRSGRHRRMYGKHARRHSDEADPGEILARIVTDIGKDQRTDGERAGEGEQERGAVGRALRDLTRGDRAFLSPADRAGMPALTADRRLADLDIDIRLIR